MFRDMCRHRRHDDENDKQLDCGDHSGEGRVSEGINERKTE